MFFVKIIFKQKEDSLFLTCCIDLLTFQKVVQKPAESSLYKSSDDILKIIFVVSHHTLMKYTVTKQVEADSFLSEDKNDSITSSHKFQTGKKLVRTSKKLKSKKLNAEDIIEYEQKDSLLAIKECDFEIFMINYSSLFSDLFYYIIVNKNHIL